MKKAIAAILTLLLLLAPVAPLTVFGAEDRTMPATEYIPGSQGSRAWSYILVRPYSGSSSRTHYVYSNYQTTTPPIEGVISEQEGMSYDLESNTLTITSLDAEDLNVTVHNMGTGFKVNLAGRSALRSFAVINEGWDSALTIDGSGSIVLGNKKDHNNVPLDVTGHLTILDGEIECIAEETDVQSIGGLRYSFFVGETGKGSPLTSYLNWTGNLESKESTDGKSIVSSKETVKFAGQALSAPTVKRKSKRLVKWKPVDGCTYQVMIDGKVIDVDQNMIKSKQKVSVRIVKDVNGSIIYSPWSKEV